MPTSTSKEQLVIGGAFSLLLCKQTKAIRHAQVAKFGHRPSTCIVCSFIPDALNAQLAICVFHLRPRHAMWGRRVYVLPREFIYTVCLIVGAARSKKWHTPLRLLLYGRWRHSQFVLHSAEAMDLILWVCSLNTI
jgi:hypothetical protein